MLKQARMLKNWGSKRQRFHLPATLLITSRFEDHILNHISILLHLLESLCLLFQFMLCNEHCIWLQSARTAWLSDIQKGYTHVCSPLNDDGASDANTLERTHQQPPRGRSLRWGSCWLVQWCKTRRLSLRIGRFPNENPLHHSGSRLETQVHPWISY